MSYINDPGARLTARAPDGTGNNAGGAAHDAYRRITPNSYEDGRGEMPLPIAPLGPVPAALAPFADYDGDLARPRDITEQVMAQPAGIDVPNRFGISEYFQFFGQFLTHDIAEAELHAHRILILADGEMLFSGTAAELKTAGDAGVEDDLEQAFVAFLRSKGH